MEKRAKKLTGPGQDDKTKSSPSSWIPCEYVQVPKGNLREVNMVLKKGLSRRNMLGRQSSDERLCMNRKGRNDIKELKRGIREKRLGLQHSRIFYKRANRSK